MGLLFSGLGLILATFSFGFRGSDVPLICDKSHVHAARSSSPLRQAVECQPDSKPHSGTCQRTNGFISILLEGPDSFVPFFQRVATHDLFFDARLGCLRPYCSEPSEITHGAEPLSASKVRRVCSGTGAGRHSVAQGAHPGEAGRQGGPPSLCSAGGTQQEPSC
jgi:hypothetical protein